MVRWLHRRKQKAYKRPITHTWKRNRRSWRYSANMSSIRTICEKIRTRWPVSFNLHSSLSSRNSFPLPRIRVCWKGITKRSHQGYESAQATVFPVTCTYCTTILSNNIQNEKGVFSVSYTGSSEEKIRVLPTRAVKTVLSGTLIMNNRRLWNSHQRHKFLRAVASRDILEFRVSEMPFQGFSRGIFPPWMPCRFVRIHARLGTMPSHGSNVSQI